MITLRRMTVDDIDVVADLEAALFPDAWTRTMVEEELAAPGRYYIVATDGVEIVGYAGVWLGLEDAQVMTIGVADSRRGEGIGRMLMTDLIRVSESVGMARVLLEVRVDNAVARGLYESLGFDVVGYRRKYYAPDGMDAAVMALVFDPSAGTPWTTAPSAGTTQGSTSDEAGQGV